MGIGAYTTAIMAAATSISVWWSIPVAAAVAGVVGFVFGFPALRLHGPYLALGTFALAIAFFELAPVGQARSSLADERRPDARVRRAVDAVLPDVVDRARAAAARLAPPLGEARAVVPRGPRRRARGGVVRPQPRGLQDARLRHRGRLRGHRRRSARDPARLGQLPHLCADCSRSRSSWGRRSAASARSSGRSSARSSSSTRR